MNSPKLIGVISFTSTLLFAAGVIALRAQTPAEPNFMGCSDIADSGSRLRCFDEAVRRENITVSKRTAGKPFVDQASIYQEMDITDLKVDFARIRGKKVQTAGNLVIFANTLMLRRDADDTNSIFIQDGKVSRDQRRAVIERCGGLGCQAVILGTIGSVFGGSGIIADSISVKD